MGERERAKEEGKKNSTEDILSVSNFKYVALCRKCIWIRWNREILLVRRLFGPIDACSSSRDVIASTLNRHLIRFLCHFRMKHALNFSSILYFISMLHDVFSNYLHFFAVFRVPIDRRVSRISSEFCFVMVLKNDCSHSIFPIV